MLSINKPLQPHSPSSNIKAITPAHKFKYKTYDSKSQNASSSSQSSDCRDSSCRQKYNSFSPETNNSFQRKVRKAHKELSPIEKINECALKAKILKEKRSSLEQISLRSVKLLKKKELQTLHPKKLLEIIHLRKIRESALIIWRFWKMHKIAKSYSSMQYKINISVSKIQIAWKKYYFRKIAAKLKSQLFNNMSAIIVRVVKAYQLVKHLRDATIESTLMHNILTLEMMGHPHKQSAAHVIVKFMKAYMLYKDIKEFRCMNEIDERKDRRMSEGLNQMRRASKIGAKNKRCSLFNNVKYNYDCYSEVIRLKM